MAGTENDVHEDAFVVWLGGECRTTRDTRDETLRRLYGYKNVHFMANDGNICSLSIGMISYEWCLL